MNVYGLHWFMHDHGPLQSKSSSYLNTLTWVYENSPKSQEHRHLVKRLLVWDRQCLSVLYPKIHMIPCLRDGLDRLIKWDGFRVWQVQEFFGIARQQHYSIGQLTCKYCGAEKKRILPIIRFPSTNPQTFFRFFLQT